MRKALQVVPKDVPKDGDDPDEMELLLSRKSPAGKKGSSYTARLKFYGALLAMGLIGTVLCLWAMLDTSDSKQRIQSLGLHKVANSLDNILALLAYPVIMFTVILSIYASQQLYKVYKDVNDPSNFRRNR